MQTFEGLCRLSRNVTTVLILPYFLKQHAHWQNITLKWRWDQTFLYRLLMLRAKTFPKDNNNNKQQYFSVISNSMDKTKTSWLPPHASNLAIFHFRESVTSIFSMKPKLQSLSLISVTLRPYSFSTTNHFLGSSSASISISSSSPNCGALNSSVSNTEGRNSTLLRLSRSCSTKFGPSAPNFSNYWLATT